MTAETTTPSHDLYKTGDKNAPPNILDRNGEVALGQCKRCGRAEAELTEPCDVPAGGASETIDVQEAWLAVGGNPNVVVTRDVLLRCLNSLRVLDAGDDAEERKLAREGLAVDSGAVKPVGVVRDDGTVLWSTDPGEMPSHTELFMHAPPDTAKPIVPETANLPDGFILVGPGFIRASRPFTEIAKKAVSAAERLALVLHETEPSRLASAKTNATERSESAEQ